MGSPHPNNEHDLRHVESTLPEAWQLGMRLERRHRANATARRPMTFLLPSPPSSGPGGTAFA
jgi:hypothetical protein